MAHQQRNETDPFPDNPFLNTSIGLSAALVTFTFVGAVCVTVFCVVRTWFSHIYSPRRALKKGRPPKLPPGFVQWMFSVYSVPEAFVLRTVGLDGVMFLRFLKTSTAMFLLLSLFGLGVLMPTNYFSSQTRNSSAPHLLDLMHLMDLMGKPKGPDVPLPLPYDEKAALKALTIENVPYNSPYLRIHLLFTWLFSLLAYACLIAFYRAHVNLKHHYASNVLKRTSLSKIEYRSIMLFNLPPDLHQEIECASYFESLEIGRVENVVVCRQWFKLREAIRKRFYYLQQLERIFADAVRNHALKPVAPPSAGPSTTLSVVAEVDSAPNSPNEDYTTDAHAPLLQNIQHLSPSEIQDPGLREIISRLGTIKPDQRPHHHIGFLGIFGERVDSIDYYAEKYLEWDTAVRELRAVPEDSPCTAVAFVTFESPQSAILASQIMIQKRPFACIAKMAPEPRDIYWPNVSSRTASSTIKIFRSLLMNSISILIFLSSILWVAFSSILPSWTKLPFLEDLFDKLSEPVKDLLQQVVPVALFTSWTSCLPYLLLIICQLQGLEAQSWIEQAVFSKYYTYQIFNILLYIAGLTIWRQILDPVANNRTPLDVIGDLMPKSSSQIIALVLIQSLAINPAQLLQIGPLIWTWLVRNSPWSRNSPRDTSDAYFPSLLSSLNLGVSYTIPAVIWVVGLTYSCIAPLILPFCALFFAIAYFVNKYILLYVHVPKYETGGMHVPIVVTRLMYGVAIFQVTMMAVLAIKYGGSWNEPGKPGEWSNYVQMILGVLPLIVINVLVYWWFQNGYEKLVTNLPMEVMGKVLRETRSSDENGDIQPSPARNSLNTPRARRSRVFGTSGPSSPLPAQSAAAAESLGCLPQRHNSADSLLSPRMPTSLAAKIAGSIAGSPSNENMRRRASQQQIERIMGLVSDNPEVTPIFDDGPVGNGGVTIRAGSPTRRTQSNPSATGQTVVSIQGGTLPNDFDDETDLDGALMGVTSGASRVNPHLEPPAFRVPGILDAPFSSGAIPKGDEQKLLLGDGGLSGGNDEGSEASRSSVATAGVVRDVVDPNKEDLQNYTYIHPALIGRLPVAWLDLAEQPDTLKNARSEQISAQKSLVRRIIRLQRDGVAVRTGEDGLDPIPNRGRVAAGGVAGFFTLRPLIDGITGWAYMNMG